MAFATDTRDARFASINITPLVDVLLVLLVIFMIAAPVMTRTIGLDLPGKSPPANRAIDAATIDLRINAAGEIFWNGNATPLSALQPMLEAELQRDPAHPPLLRINASGDSDYGAVARVLAATRNADWARIAFVME